jgi:hypothetical protein
MCNDKEKQLMKKIILGVFSLFSCSLIHAQQDSYTAEFYLDPTIVMMDKSSYGLYIHIPQMGSYLKHTLSEKMPWYNDELVPLIPNLRNLCVALPEGYRMIPGGKITVEGDEVTMNKGITILPYNRNYATSDSLALSDGKMVSEYEKSLCLPFFPHHAYSYPREEYNYFVGDAVSRTSGRYSAVELDMFSPFRYAKESLYMWKKVRITLPIERRTDMPELTEADSLQDKADLQQLRQSAIDFGYSFDSQYGPLKDYVVTHVSPVTASGNEALRVRFNNRGLPLALCTLPKGSKGHLTVCDVAGRLLTSHNLTDTYNSVEIDAATGSVLVLTLYVDGRQVASQKCTV